MNRAVVNIEDIVWVQKTARDIIYSGQRYKVLRSYTVVETGATEVETRWPLLAAITYTVPPSENTEFFVAENYYDLLNAS